MPYDPPDRATILQEIKADMRLELGVDPLRRSPEYALARALTGQSKGQYGRLRWIFRQALPDSAEAEILWRWMNIFGVPRNAATPWQGVYRFTGVDTTAIPIGTELVRVDGKLYTTDAAAVVGSVSSGYVDVAITASENGADSNAEAADTLELSTPIADVDDEGTIQSVTTDGADIETPEAGLERLLSHLQEPPSGGGPGDYVKWAREVSGVTRAWEFPNLYGTNTVGVAFVRDDDGSGAAIIPSSGERDTVQAYLDSKAPITVTVYVLAIAAQSINVTLSALNPNTTAVQDAITEALEAFFRREAAPGGTLELSRFDAAVSAGFGEISHTLSAPAADVDSTTLEMPILGTVSFP